MIVINIYVLGPMGFVCEPCTKHALGWLIGIDMKITVRYTTRAKTGVGQMLGTVWTIQIFPVH